MICPKCHSDWTVAIIDNKRVHQCSSCGYVDARITTVDGEDITAPDNIGGKYFPIKLHEGLPPIASFFAKLGL